MKTCKYCGKEFSHSVYPLHIKRCKAKQEEPETPKAPVEPDVPQTPQEPKAPVEPDVPQTPQEPAEVKPYAEMTEPELRVLAKNKGISSYHNKGLDKIIAELEEMDLEPAE